MEHVRQDLKVVERRVEVPIVHEKLVTVEKLPGRQLLILLITRVEGNISSGGWNLDGAFCLI